MFLETECYLKFNFNYKNKLFKNTLVRSFYCVLEVSAPSVPNVAEEYLLTIGSEKQEITFTI